MFIIFDQAQQVGSPVLGYIIPAFILIVAVGLTWMLYKKFSNPH